MLLDLEILKDLHLEHIWDNENFELGKNFDNLVRKLITNKEEEEWRERMKKEQLRLYRKIKNRLVLVRRLCSRIR